MEATTMETPKITKTSALVVARKVTQQRTVGTILRMKANVLLG
jgi:hypothetical protein